MLKIGHQRLLSNLKLREHDILKIGYQRLLSHFKLREYMLKIGHQRLLSHLKLREHDILKIGYQRLLSHFKLREYMLKIGYKRLLSHLKLRKYNMLKIITSIGASHLIVAVCIRYQLASLIGSRWVVCLCINHVKVILKITKAPSKIVYIFLVVNIFTIPTSYD